MMQVLAFLNLISVLVASAQTRVDYTGHQVLKVVPENENVNKIMQEIGDLFQLKFWKGPFSRDGTIDVQVSKDKLDSVKSLLARKGIEYSVFINDVQEAIDQERSPRLPQNSLAEFDYNKYHTFDEITAWLHDFAENNSDFATVKEVGVSYQNRTFYAVKLSSGPSETTKPAFMIDCGIHANEWIGPATCIHVIRYIVQNMIHDDEKYSKQVNAVDFYIIPSSNPDGYVYAWAKDRMWRKTRSPTSNNCFGVDPNRNFDSNWAGNGSNSDPCSNNYRGPHPWSEANVRAQRDFVNAIENLQGYIDVHAYGQLWMFPYGYTNTQARDNNLMSKIANQSVAAIYNVHQKQYTSGPIATTIYIASGSTSDYFYDHNNLRCSFAAELRDKGEYGMLLPENQIQPTAEEAFAGLMAIAQWIPECGNAAQRHFIYCASVLSYSALCSVVLWIQFNLLN